jgi:hypothetical protein
MDLTTMVVASERVADVIRASGSKAGMIQEVLLE